MYAECIPTHLHNPCENCGERKGTHLQDGYDITPTDREDERIYCERWVCDECDPRQEN